MYFNNSVFMEIHSNSFDENNSCLWESHHVILMSQFVMHFSSRSKKYDLWYKESIILCHQGTPGIGLRFIKINCFPQTNVTKISVPSFKNEENFMTLSHT